MANLKSDKKVDNKRSTYYFWAQVKDIVNKSAAETIAHGFLNISQAKDWFIRTVWIVCLLASCGYCLYCVVDVTTDYFNYPIVTKVEVVDELTTYFPTVMMCNLNPFNTDNQEVISWMKENVYLVGADNHTATWLYSYLATEAFKSVAKVLYLLDSNSAYDKSRQLHTSMISCSFGSTTCSLDDFELVYVYDYINCYKFNANGTRTISRRGFAYGLQLEFYIGNSSSPQDALYFGNRGIRFMVFNSSFGNAFIYDQGSDATPGLVTNVQVTKKYNDRLSSPYSDCLDDLTPQSSGQSATMQVMFQELNQTRYSQIYCQNLCLQGAVISRCRCYLFRYPYSDRMIAQTNNTPCGMNQYISCALPTIQSLATSGSKCQTECKTECKYFDYDSTVTTSEYMTNWYWSHLKNYSNNYVAEDNSSIELERESFFHTFSQIETLSEARDSTLKLNVFLDQIGFISTSETPFYSFNSFLGAVGGQLGLFLGVSLLSSVELFEMIYLIVIAYVGYRFNRGRSIKPNIEKIDSLN